MKLGPYELDQIYAGDARELTKAIPDESVDLIFTDPPYPKEYLQLYEWLAEEAARILRSDGFLMTYAGIYHKDASMALLRRHMEYFFDFAAVNDGNAPIMWPRKIISRWKSLLSYRKLGSIALPRVNVISFWVGSGQDKRFHIWGQDESTSRYYIDCFSSSSSIVLDPFAGGGTVPAVCKMLGRHYLAFEIDPDTAERARQRVENTQLPLFVIQSEQAEMFAEDSVK